MKDFRKLKVWDKAHVIALEIYRHTSGFPREELYGITSQMRRASTSVELEYFLLLARDLGMINHQTYDGLQAQVVELQRMLSGLLRTVATARQKPLSTSTS